MMGKGEDSATNLNKYLLDNIYLDNIYYKNSGKWKAESFETILEGEEIRVVEPGGIKLIVKKYKKRRKIWNILQ
ncbi:MAG: hypothetical protein FWG13_00205 [Leptospirales bacterium]|nr:hypothetical protein [Leptospirales bacterium]